MNDPHVEALFYDIGTGSDSITYEDPADASFENEIGAFELSDCKLKVIPANHYASADSARHVVDPFLKSWEVHTDLKANLGQIRFTYRDAKIIDCSPPHKNGNVTLQVQSAVLNITSHPVTIKIGCGKYPEPPSDFRASPEVEIAHTRWAKFRQGKEPLQSVAYFVFTVLKVSAGGVREASKKYGIPFKTLRRISELSTLRGNPETARKAQSTQYVELTGKESSWLEKAIRDVIIQLGRSR
jgi:hypothetical protein